MSVPVARDADVLVCGGGVGGMTAALLAARAGMRVVCVEPKRFPRRRVGESLDWSAPSLLGTLGLGRDDLVEGRFGTYKREVQGITSSGRRLVAGPPSWLGRWPMRFEHVTLHLDRERFDRQLFEEAVEAGVEFDWDRVRTVEMDADRVGRCMTGSGRSFRAKWYVDASGRSRIIGRAASIGTRRWSCERIGLWCQRESPMPVGATVLHFDEAADDLAWAWEIPIAAGRCSVGVVMPLAEFRAHRREGLVIDEVFARVLDRLPHLDARQLTGPIYTRTYQPYVSQRVAGANWMMVGEAAALVDPISSIGVTAALRHGSEAAAIIARSRRVPESADRMLAEYDRRTRSVAVLYNEAVDSLLYRPQLRQRFGMKVAGRAYVIVGYLTNALYTRVDPTASTGRSTALSIVLAVSRQWVRSWRAVSHATAPATQAEEEH